MKESFFIKRIGSALLLGVFVISITPKQVLHDILTHHRHIEGKTKNGIAVSQVRYNCDDENFVAHSPFVEQTGQIKLKAPTVFREDKNIFFTSYCFHHQIFFGFRGPPSRA